MQATFYVVFCYSNRVSYQFFVCFVLLFQTVGSKVKNSNILVRKAVDFLLQEKEHSLVITHTAREWIFDGFGDELLALLKKLNISGFNIPFDKFGWFYGVCIDSFYCCFCKLKYNFDVAKWICKL